MELRTALLTVGGLLQVAGLLVLAYGITQIRTGFVRGSDGWWVRLWHWVTQVSVRAWRRVQRLFGVQHHVHGEAHLTSVVGVSSFGTARLTREHWPDDIDERWDEVRFRTDRNLELIQNADDRIAEQGRELEALADVVEVAKVEAREAAEQEVAALAAAGSRTESISVLLLAFGLVFTTWGALISPAV